MLFSLEYWQNGLYKLSTEAIQQIWSEKVNFDSVLTISENHRWRLSDVIWRHSWGMIVAILGLYVMSWPPCWCTITIELQLHYFVVYTNMAAIPFVIWIPGDWVQTKNRSISQRFMSIPFIYFLEWGGRGWGWGRGRCVWRPSPVQGTEWKFAKSFLTTKSTRQTGSILDLICIVLIYIYFCISLHIMYI